MWKVINMYMKVTLLSTAYTITYNLKHHLTALNVKVQEIPFIQPTSISTALKSKHVTGQELPTIQLGGSVYIYSTCVGTHVPSP